MPQVRYMYMKKLYSGSIFSRPSYCMSANMHLNFAQLMKMWWYESLAAGVPAFTHGVEDEN